MAEPKGTYYSGQGSETGWATVLPQQPRANFFKTLMQLPLAQMKAKQAEDKLKQQQLSKLTGQDVGRFHHEAYQRELEQLFNDAPNLNSLEFNERVVMLGAGLGATKDVAKMYDTDRKWAEGKDIPIKKEEWLQEYTARNYANPDMATAAQWAQNPPDKGFFLKEDGGSQYIDAGRAVRRVIRDNFKETLTTQSLEMGGWNKIPIGYEKNNLTYKHKLQAFAKVENDEIVIKDYKELIQSGVLEAFTSDEYTKRLLIDKAKEMQVKAGKPAEDDDITELELGMALEEVLQPYVAGAVQESGVTLTIRPVSSGSGGSEKFRTGYNLWVKHYSEGSPAAANYALGAKTEFGEVVGFTPSRRDVVAIYANPAKLQQRLERESWFRSMTANQKRDVVAEATKSAAENYDPNNPAQIYHVVTFREKITTSSSSKDVDQERPAGTTTETTSYKYNIRVINPARTDTGFLSLIYAGGRKARGGMDYDVASSPGQMGYEFEQEAESWVDPNTPKPQPQAKRKPM